MPKEGLKYKEYCYGLFKKATCIVWGEPSFNITDESVTSWQLSKIDCRNLRSSEDWNLARLISPTTFLPLSYH